ncbi:60S ribosomal protein L35-1 [Striga hermonthica]|uniref:60S ribosomal protein L35-1 n=1 Tax=Striga hermonthica TaxID=68872 RepID=A0A9N7P2C0_STRHE|nr:60S ribosomal protein L35-1 [Striga hermonthica]
MTMSLGVFSSIFLANMASLARCKLAIKLLLGLPSAQLSPRRSSLRIGHHSPVNFSPSPNLSAKMARIKVHELRQKSKADLLQQLKELKAELSLLRVVKVTGGTPTSCRRL